MTPAQMKRLDQNLDQFLDDMTAGMGRPESRRALCWYFSGLLLEGECKTVVSMAHRLVDDESESEAFIVDDTGFPKKGRYSVGVARQYSGTMGRVENCQLATSLHLATDSTSGCIGMRLYLPEDWASDIPRRRQAGVPDDVVFRRKWELAIDLLDEALSWGLAPRVTLADSAYGDSTECRDALVARGCHYVVGVSSQRLAGPPGSRPRKPVVKPGQVGRKPTRYRDGHRKPRALAEIARRLSYRQVSCPDGQGGTKSGRFALARLHLAERHTKGRPPSDELWLIAEHRPGNNEYKYYVSDLRQTNTKRELVRRVKSCAGASSATTRR